MRAIRLTIVLLVLAISGLAQHSATLNWTWAQGSGDIATGYHIYWATVTGGPYTYLDTTSVTTYADLVVVAGSTYYYKVTAYNSSGDSDITLSNEASGT